MNARDSSRTRQAVRRAREARAAREQALAAREEAIEATLVAYFQAIGEVERITQQAQVKADALLAEAARTAATPRAAACAAVRQLRELVGNNAQVAELCGLKLEEVRDMLAATRADEAPPDASETEGHEESRTTPDGAAGEPAPGEPPPQVRPIDPLA